MGHKIFDHIADGLRLIGVKRYEDEAVMKAEMTIEIGGSDMLAFNMLEKWMEGGVEEFEALQEIIVKAQYLIMHTVFLPLDDPPRDHGFSAAREAIIELMDAGLKTQQIYHVFESARWWVFTMNNIEEFTGMIYGKPITREQAAQELGAELRERFPEEFDERTSEEITDGMKKFIEFLTDEDGAFGLDIGRGVMTDGDGRTIRGSAKFVMSNEASERPDVDAGAKWSGRAPFEKTDIMSDEILPSAFDEWMKENNGWPNEDGPPEDLTAKDMTDLIDMLANSNPGHEFSKADEEE